jgi:ubiquinone/menaquinone biosynthesis C-methylase UbiE
MHIQEAIEFIQHTALSATTPVTWADLGCGAGTFTRALAHYLPEGSTIYAVDKQPPAGIKAPAGIAVKPLQLDFVKEVFPFTSLNGIILANALHYVKDQSAFLEKIKTVLQPDGILLIVEYDTDTPVPVWVPHPLSYATLEKLFRQQGFRQVEKMRERTSMYGRANLYTAFIRR